MIKLNITAGEKDRVIMGVRFTDGKAEVHESLLKKVKRMSRFYHVVVEGTEDIDSENEVDTEEVDTEEVDTEEVDTEEVETTSVFGDE